MTTAVTHPSTKKYQLDLQLQISEGSGQGRSCSLSRLQLLSKNRQQRLQSMKAETLHICRRRRKKMGGQSRDGNKVSGFFVFSPLSPNIPPYPPPPPTPPVSKLGVSGPDGET